jgi:hypothetical protein
VPLSGYGHGRRRFPDEICSEDIDRRGDVGVSPGLTVESPSRDHDTSVTEYDTCGICT